MKEFATNFDGMNEDEIVIDKSYLLYEFPADRKRISRLTLDQKMEWYQYQFQRLPGVYPIELLNEDFVAYWKWRVLIPTKIKRLYYRIKNLEIFKHYEHISDIRKKMKKYMI